MRHKQPVEAVVLLLDGNFPSTTIAPLEILSAAGVLWEKLRGKEEKPLFNVRAASPHGKRTMTLGSLAITPPWSIDDVRNADLIVVPAAGADLTAACRHNAFLLPLLRKWHGRGAAIAGICTGVTLLAEAGLLDGRNATSHWAYGEELRARYPDVRWQMDRFVTEDRNMFCSGGVYSAIDLSLYLVEKFGGHRVAMETAKSLLIETPRIWQSAYAAEAPTTSHADAPVRKTQQHLFRHFREEVSIDDLAARAGMSSRNFARRFKAATGDTPLAYLQRLRINAAKHLLERKSASIQEVSEAVGYDDALFFRRLFKRHTGVAPTDYRLRFGIEA